MECGKRAIKIRQQSLPRRPGRRAGVGEKLSGPNGRSQRWNCRLQAVRFVLSASQLGSQRQDMLGCLKAEEISYRETLSLPFKSKPAIKPLTHNPHLLSLMAAILWGLMLSHKIESEGSNNLFFLCKVCPGIVGFLLLLLPGSFPGWELLNGWE